MRTRVSIFVAILFAFSITAGFCQQIASFETEDELKLFGAGGGVKLERAEQYPSDGKWSLKAFFPGSDKDSWPGISYDVTDDSTEYQVFAFDVYNAEKGAVSISWRIDLEDGGTQFGGQGIGPSGSTSVEIWVSGVPKIKRFFPYIRMPREDHTLYFDNFRWATVDARFTALHYVDESPAPEPLALDTERGFVLYQRPFADVVFANTVPGPQERIEAVQVFATPGEYEPATFSVYALDDLKAVRVSLEGIPAKAEVLPVRCLDKRVTYSSKEYIKAMPVLCERREEVDVAKANSKRFVLELQIDDDAAPRVYEGKISVDRDGGQTVTIPLRLRVLPFKLSEPTDMFWGEYYTGPKLATTDDEKFAALERDMIDMREHGMTSVGLCFGVPDEKVTWEVDGSCRIDFDGTSLYERFMELYVELGYPMPVILLSDSGQGAAGKAGDFPFDSDEWGDHYKTFWSTMQQIHKDRGWPEVIVQPVDEPGWQDRSAKERNVRCLKLLKQIPGMRTEQDGPGDGYFHGEAGPYSDVWNYNGAIANPEDVKKYQADGKIIVLYNCDVESYRPETDRYVAGWFQAASGASGCYNWAYMSWNGSPYDDNDHKTGTWMHVYPPMGDEPGGPSTGWIGAREGIDDYKYIHTLRQLVSEAKKSGKAEAIKAAGDAELTLDSVIASLRYSPRVRSMARWTEAGRAADGRKTIGGTLKIPNDWEHAEYEKARWRVAQATLTLMGAMGRLPGEVKGEQADADTGPLVADTRWREVEPEKAPQVGGKNARQVTIPVWDDSPVIDGEFNDAVWKRAAKLDPFTISTGSAEPQMQTDVLVGSDGKSLFLGVTCHEDNMGHITAKVSQDGGAVWEDDCVEIFIDANLDQNTFRQVLVNSLGTQGWNDTTDSKWRAASIARTKSLDDRWTVELAIPMADLGITGGQFGLNVCRERRPMETLELSCWSATGGGFAVPDKFGLASLGQAWIGSVSIAPASIGRNKFTVSMRNETDKPARITHILTMQWAERTEKRTIEPPYELAPGDRKQFTYEYELHTEEVPAMTFQAAKCPPELGVFAERSFAPVMQSPLQMALRPRVYYLSENLGAAEFEVNLSPSVRDKSRLTIALYDADEQRVVRQSKITPIAGNRLGATINLRGLNEGSFRLWALLDGPDGKRIAESSARIERLRGPFD